MEYDTTLHAMVLKGTNYREDREYERFGETAKVSIRPLDDEEYLPLMGALGEITDVDAEDAEEILEEAEGEVEEAQDKVGGMDVSQLDEEFVNVVQAAAALGIEAAYTEDGEKAPVDNDEARELVGKMKGGVSIEIGMDVMELSGDVTEAEKFR